MKKIMGMCLLVAFVLTGCAKDNLYSQYVKTEEIEMLDTEQEIMDANNQLKKSDGGEWSYRPEKIQSIEDLVKNIKASCANEKTRIRIERQDSDLPDLSQEDSEGLSVWARYAKEGKKPTRKERVAGISIMLEMKDRESMLANCHKLAELGFSSLHQYSGKDMNIVQNGYGITAWGDTDEEEEEEEYYPYEIDIQIAGIMLYGPERYFDLADACLENGLFIAEFVCCNGAVDAMALRGENVWLNVYMKDDKILEIVAGRDVWKNGTYFSENEQKGMAELLTRMCGDRNAAVSMLKELTPDGKKNGIVGKCEWSINKRGRAFESEEATYQFHIQNT